MTRAEEMVARQIARRGVRDERVLEAMRKVPRHAFVDPSLEAEAYGDWPLPIGHGQTISQPYVVGAMSEALEVAPDDRVLEVGTGSGYQAAVLAEMGVEVFSLEIIPELALRAAVTLAGLGYHRVHVRTGSGYDGWLDAAPFDGIIVTAAPRHLPESLRGQLRVGRHLVIPEGGALQMLKRYTLLPDGRLAEEDLFTVRFVPMV